MGRVRAIEIESGISFEVSVGESLLKGMEKSGSRIVDVGCRGGGCGLCKVQVLTGDFEVGKMSSLHISDLDKDIGCTLACRCFPKTNIEFVLVKNKKLRL